MKKYVPHYTQHMPCPADRDMVFNLITKRSYILSCGTLTAESARWLINIHRLDMDEPIELDIRVHCADCPRDGCHLTGTLNKERG